MTLTGDSISALTGVEYTLLFWHGGLTGGGDIIPTQFRYRRGDYMHRRRLGLSGQEVVWHAAVVVPTALGSALAGRAELNWWLAGEDSRTMDGQAGRAEPRLKLDDGLARPMDHARALTPIHFPGSSSKSGPLIQVLLPGTLHQGRIDARLGPYVRCQGSARQPVPRRLIV